VLVLAKEVTVGVVADVEEVTVVVDSPVVDDTVAVEVAVVDVNVVEDGSNVEEVAAGAVVPDVEVTDVVDYAIIDRLDHRILALREAQAASGQQKAPPQRAIAARARALSAT